jgi:hypothetical protein
MQVGVGTPARIPSGLGELTGDYTKHLPCGQAERLLNGFSTGS